MPVIRLVQPKSPTTVDVPYLSTRAPGANTESVTQTKAATSAPDTARLWP